MLTLIISPLTNESWRYTIRFMARRTDYPLYRRIFECLTTSLPILGVFIIAVDISKIMKIPIRLALHKIKYDLI